MLTQKEKQFLEENGYLNLGVLLSESEVNSINARMEELKEIEGENAGKELVESKYIRHPKEEGADRLADLVNKGKIFDVFYTHPRVLEGIETVLGKEFKLSSLNYRPPNRAWDFKTSCRLGNTVVDSTTKFVTAYAWMISPWKRFYQDHSKITQVQAVARSNT